MAYLGDFFDENFFRNIQFLSNIDDNFSKNVEFFPRSGQYSAVSVFFFCDGNVLAKPFLVAFDPLRWTCLPGKRRKKILQLRANNGHVVGYLNLLLT